jgi:7-cyano-7-deazaguanine synthase
MVENLDGMREFSELAVLISGGLDSAVLLGEAVHMGKTVHPLYIRCGLYWEPTELEYLGMFLKSLAGANLRPLQILDMPIRDVYKCHWSVSGDKVPDADSPDEAVFLPGRNVLLLSKALLWCHLEGVPALALAVLSANPFPDATPDFFRAYQDVVNEAVGGNVAVLRPYAGLSKVAVVQRGRDLPLQWTFSCMQPHRGRHCGACNKCAERMRAFREAAVADPTVYDQEGACSA